MWSARTHGSEKVPRDVIPCQLQPPQGSVAGETAHQGPAPQEANVVPAQVWEEKVVTKCTWRELARPGVLSRGEGPSLWPPTEQEPSSPAPSPQHLSACLLPEATGGPREGQSRGLTQLLEAGIACQGQGQLLCALVADLVVAEVQLPQGTIARQGPAEGGESVFPRTQVVPLQGETAGKADVRRVAPRGILLPQGPGGSRRGAGFGVAGRKAGAT